MKVSLKVPILFLLIVPCCIAQNPNKDSVITVLESSWQRARQAAKKTDNAEVGPAKMMTPDDKYYQRTAREQQTKSTVDPSENTIDGRRAALEKIVQESRNPKPGDVNGYSYITNVRNDGTKKIEIVFWEYRFTELANPVNVVRRQFLCSANIKPGEKKELSVFSLLGPSDVISAESLGLAKEKLFDEKIFVNRIEFSDGTMLQRRDWKFEDVQKSVERVTSTSWGKEICRAI